MADYMEVDSYHGKKDLHQSEIISQAKDTLKEFQKGLEVLLSNLPKTSEGEIDDEASKSLHLTFFVFLFSSLHS